MDFSEAGLGVLLSLFSSTMFVELHSSTVSMDAIKVRLAFCMAYSASCIRRAYIITKKRTFARFDLFLVFARKLDWEPISQDSVGQFLKLPSLRASSWGPIYQDYYYNVKN
jgi:hypothetical protein